MALPRSSRALPRLAAISRLIVRKRSSGETGGARRTSCGPEELPPCAQCERAPRPPCRAPPPPARPRVVRLACRAPPAGLRPPCAASPPPCPRTCEHARPQSEKFTSCDTVQCTPEEKCGGRLDFVAARLAGAERMRRAEYEREVTARAPPPASPGAPYRLADERDDACGAADARRASPRAARAESSRNCEISRGPHVDPCPDRPRIVVDIDRTATANVQTSSSKRTDVAPDDEKIASSGGIAARIVETLTRGRSQSSRPSDARDSPCTAAAAGATRAGDDGWCESMPRPAAAPLRCKSPSLKERLRLRSGDVEFDRCGSKRKLHTQTETCGGKVEPSAPKATDVESNKRKLEAALSAKSQLKEAGRGRVVAEQNAKRCKSTRAGGLELRVPSEAEVVRVTVTLESTEPIGCDPPKNSGRGHQRQLSSVCDTEGSDSWLSIKKLQKKLSGCQKPAENVNPERPDVNSKSVQCPVGPPPPCGRPAGRSPPAAPCPHTATATSPTPGNKPQFSSFHKFSFPV